MDEKQIIELMQKIKSDVVMLAAAAGCYFNVYNDVMKAIEIKYGKHDAEVIKRSAILSSTNYMRNKIKELEEDD